MIEQYNLIGNAATNFNVNATTGPWLPLTNALGQAANTTASIHHSYVGSNATVVALNLGPLLNNGGKTMTKALLGGDMAVDHGTNSSYNGITSLYDQRGVPYERTYGIGADIGAYEYKAGPTNLTYNSYGWVDQPWGSGQIPCVTTNAVPAPMILTLDNATFTGANNTPWSTGQVNANIVISNVPAGLVVNAMPTNSLSSLVIWLTGTATAPHGAANSVSNILFCFTDAAFSNPVNNATAAQINNASNNAPNLNITLHDAVSAGTLTYTSGTNFYADITYNDGRIATTNTIVLSGDVWTNKIASGSLTNYVTFTGVPNGLTGQVDATSAGGANFYFTGQATSHAAANSVSNVVLTFSASAFQTGHAAANSSVTNVITFYNPASLVTLNYSGSSFSENVANDGTMGGSITVTLVSNLFVAGVASCVSSPDLPANLALNVAYVNNTNITINLTGSAVNNNMADNKSFHIQFQTNAFYNLSPGVSVVNSNAAVSLLFLNPSITWIGSFTALLPNNDGTIDPATYVTGTLVGDTFAGAASSAFTPTNLPSGLTMNVATTSPTTVQVTLTGKATAHAVINNTNNLGLAFQNSAFTKSSTDGGAAAVTNSSVANWSITFYDPSKKWYVSQTGNDSTGTGTNSSTPFATISNAIAHASANNYDIIHILPGTITECEGEGTNNSNGANCGIIVTKPLIFEGEDTMSAHNISIVQGASTVAAATNRLFNLGNTTLGSATYAQFRNLTLRNGNDISSINGNNLYVAGGGAICSKYQYTLIITNCYIHSCVSSNNNGGAICFYPATTVSAKPCHLYIYDSIIEGNTGALGGGLYMSAQNAPALVASLYSSTFDGNVATQYGAGAYLNIDTGLVQNCTFCCNTNLGSGAVSTIYYYNFLAQGATLPAPTNLTIRNCTIASNMGGVYIQPYTSGSGMLCLLQSTILAGNTGTSTSDIMQGANNGANSVIIENNNLIGNVTNSIQTYQATITPTSPSATTTNVNGSYVGNSATIGIINPMLSPLAYNGGPTPTMPLQRGSLAIDHGANPGGLVYDQRESGYPRTVGTQPDIGAYEFGAGVNPVGTTLIFW